MRITTPVKILLSAVIPAIVVWLLYAYNDHLHRVKNNFNRNYPPHIISDFRFIDLSTTSYYFAGSYDQQVYLANYKAPGRILNVNARLDTVSRFITMPAGALVNSGKLLLKITGSHLSILDPDQSAVFSATLPSLHTTRAIYLPGNNQEEIVSLSPNSFIAKRYYPGKRQSIIYKRWTDGQVSEPPKPVLKKQVDGHFCTDGQLLYSPEYAKLFYVYRYRNQFICLDSNNTVLFESRTIDTNFTVKINIDSFSADRDNREITFSAPPLIVNKYAAIAGNKLFIASPLKADNEEIERFREGVPVDIYYLQNGQYKYSIFLSDFKDIKADQFLVTGKYIFVLYAHFLGVFTFIDNHFNADMQ
jgi:hypothetical protein